MTKPLKFYQLINLEKACPRRNMFAIQGIKGQPQYYTSRIKFQKYLVDKFLVDNFSLDYEPKVSKSGQKNFGERLAEQDFSELIKNLGTILSRFTMEITEINREVLFEINNSSVQIITDALGTVEEENSLLKLNFTTRFNRTDALELACAESSLHNAGEHIEKLVVLKLGSAEIREVFKEGDRTKKGELKKGGLGPWDKLKEEAEILLIKGHKLRDKMEQNPDSYNIPVFGTCGTCPYHNFEVNFNNQKIICRG